MMRVILLRVGSARWEREGVRACGCAKNERERERGSWLCALARRVGGRAGRDLKHRKDEEREDADSGRLCALPCSHAVLLSTPHSTIVETFNMDAPALRSAVADFLASFTHEVLYQRSLYASDIFERRCEGGEGGRERGREERRERARGERKGPLLRAPLCGLLQSRPAVYVRRKSGQPARPGKKRARARRTLAALVSGARTLRETLRAGRRPPRVFFASLSR
jgi:hypothetical protein